MMYQQQQQFGGARAPHGAPQVAQPMTQTAQQGACINPRVILILSIIFLTIGGVITYTGIFGPYLIWLDVPFGTAHIGFYTGCVVVINVISCGTLIDSNSEEWLWACQVLGWVASVAAFVGWIMLICWTCQSNKSSCLKYTIIGFIFVTMVSYAVGLILFATKYEDVPTWDQYDFAWGFFIAWVGTAMILISGVLLFFQPGGVQYEQTTAMMYMGHPMGQQTMMTGQPAVVYQQQQQAQQLPMKQMYPQLGGQAHSQAYSQAYSNPSQAYSAGYNSGYR